MGQIHHMHREKIHSISALQTEVVTALQGIQRALQLGIRNLMISNCDQFLEEDVKESLREPDDHVRH